MNPYAILLGIATDVHPVFWCRGFIYHAEENIPGEHCPSSSAWFIQGCYGSPLRGVVH
jgi:hypothetical protein